jgi:hypothetical protein
LPNLEVPTPLSQPPVKAGPWRCRYKGGYPDSSSQTENSCHSLLLRPTNIAEIIPPGMKNKPKPDGMTHVHNKNTKQGSKRLEMKHTIQYFLLRQKTPPVIINTAEKIMSRLKVRP